MPVGEDDAAAGEDHGELGRRESFAASSSAAASPAPRRCGSASGSRLELAVEEVARDVQLRGAHVEHRAVEAARGDLGHALRVVHVALVLGDLREDRQLLGLLEAAQAQRHRAGLGV
jgi:hypothetical protein